MSNRTPTATALVIAMLLPALLPLVPTAAASAVFGAGTPTFDVYAAPSTFTNVNGAGEPSVGVNWNTNVALYQSGYATYSIAWDDSFSPPKPIWKDVTPDSLVGNIDPFLWTDPTLGRTWAGGLDGTCSIFQMTDDDGTTWGPVGNACVATLDHESMASGPYADPAPPSALYDHGLYYCAQAAAVTCAASYDGGLTFLPTTNVPGCDGNLAPGGHGSVHVSPNGHVWIPFSSPGIHDQVCLGHSSDNGLTWEGLSIPGTTVPSAGFDADVASTPSNWLYVGYPDSLGRARMAISKDNGATWSLSPDLGAPYNLKITTFHEAVAGDDNRAALAFLGTETGPMGSAYGTPSSYAGVWHLYVAYTYDGGASWVTTRATEDPVQRGCIYAGGTLGDQSCRNLLDFMDAQLDRDGRVIVGFADGCRNACATSTGTPAQSRAAYATVARQSGGMGLFAGDDLTAIVLADGLMGVAGQPTQISASVTGAAPYSVSVAWGDGSQVETFTGLTSPTFTASHVYATPATYTVTVTLSDANNAGASDSGSVSVAMDGSTGGVVSITTPAEDDTVGPSVRVEGTVTAGTSTNHAPVAAFTSGVSGYTVSVDASGSSDADGDALTYAWTFGDGAVASGVTASHTYAAAGTYSVCLLVSDGSATDNDCASAVIQAVGPTLVADDPPNDSGLGNPATGADDIDLTRLEALTTPGGEVQFILTVESLTTPTAHNDRAGTATSWGVEWLAPDGETDFLVYEVNNLGSSCGWGTVDDQGLYNTVGSAPCSFVSGTPGKILIAFPAAALAARGYASGDQLTAVIATSGVFYGIPAGVPLGPSGSTVYYDSTTAGSYAVADLNVDRIGVPLRAAAMPAPSQAPVDPEVVDRVDDGVAERVPHVNVSAAWFDSDATNLYVGMKIQDVPATTQQSAFIQYATYFLPGYAVEDLTWGGKLPTTATLERLSAVALYSPARANFTALPFVESDAAPVFELQYVYQDPVTGGSFGTLAYLQGSVDPTTDIIWIVVPRALLQNPPGGGALIDTSAVVSPAIGGLLDWGAGDVTGDGADYVFPSVTLTLPTVTLSASPASGDSPLDVAFAATATPTDIVSWTMVYGDGASEAGAGVPPASFSHVYTTPGSYTATLSATNPNGTGSATASVSVGGGQGSGTRVLVQAGELPAVTATCDNGCATWSADLDLSSLASGGVTITATLVQGTTSTSVDSVNVTLDNGGSGEEGLVIDAPTEGETVLGDSVTVSGRLAQVHDQAPVAFLSADRTQGLAPLDVVFTLEGSDDLGIASWQFTAGDGFVDGGSGAPPATIEHTYATGSWIATLTVRDTANQGDSQSVSIQAQAQNTPPVAPHSPVPPDGQGNVPLTTLLAWTSGDADGNALLFDVYLDTSDASTLLATDQPGSVMPPALEPATTYYWRVVAKDGTDSTQGPVWSFTTRAPVTTEADRPHVVVAVIDSGSSPYSNEFRRAGLVDSPATYISGMPASLKQINLCFFDNATKTVDQSRCPGTVAQATANDAAEWAKIGVTPVARTGAGQGNLAWFAGTNLMGISFAHDGDAGYATLDGARGAGDSHGTHVSSDVAGATTGTCPECIVVIIEGDTVDGIIAGYRWAANQPWIDVITSSVSIGFGVGVPVVGIPVGGWNPADIADANSAAAKTAVTSGKLMFEAAGNGLSNLGVAPTSTLLYGNYNPWTIPVGCSVPHSGNSCFYSDSPAPIEATGVARKAAKVDAYAGYDDAGGTSFSSPSAAGVAGRTIYALRATFNDTQEGPSATGTKSLVRVGASPAPTTGPLANGALTRLELEEILFKSARRNVLPIPYQGYIFPTELPSHPLTFAKAGYGQVYRGDYGVAGPGATATWSSAGEAVAIALGQKELPNRWVEEFWWEQVVDPTQVFIFGEDVPDSDTDAFPRDDAANPGTLVGGYAGQASLPAVPAISVDIPDGVVPTSDLNRLYFHHADLGLDPADPTGRNHLYDNYVNSVASPADPLADQSGIGATGVNGAGYTRVYTVSHPTLGGPVLLDATKDVVVHVRLSGYRGVALDGWDGVPPSPLTITATLATAGGAIVGTGTGTRTLDGTQGVYEVRFKPTSTVLTDTTEVTISWPGPAYTAHMATRGESWIDLPVLATLPPANARDVRYFADDVATGWQSNGDTLTLTRDAGRLEGDADAGRLYTVPVGNGLQANFLAEDALVSAPAILGGSGAFTVYPCTGPAFRDVGAGPITYAVALAVGGVAVGGGSVSVTQVNAAVTDPLDTPLKVPLTLTPTVLAAGQSVQATLTVTNAANVALPISSVCGGSAAHPITLDLQVTDFAGPATTLGATPGTFTGSVTLSGQFSAPASPAATRATWYAKNLDTWGDVDENTMDTSGPGADSGGPFFVPSPDGLSMTLRSARPVADDVAALGEGPVTARFWVTAIGAHPSVRVDATFLLDGPSGQRVLGTQSITRYVGEPVAIDTTNPIWNEAYDFSVAPAFRDVRAGETLVARFVIHDAGDASSGFVTCMCGDEARPVTVSLPRDASAAATAPGIDIEIGGLHRVVVPAADGSWSTTFDSSLVANGAQTLTVTPQATYAGQLRTGVPVVRQVNVQNTVLNTPPTASLSVAPASGVAPLAVVATLGGNDAQTVASLLTWSIDWGDGSAPETGTGLPATVSHTYAAGTWLAELTVRDTASAPASATAAVSASDPVVPRTVRVSLDGGPEVVAVDDSGDGSFAAWQATFTGLAAGAHEAVARYGDDESTLSSASVRFEIQLPAPVFLNVTAPAAGSRVGGDAVLVGDANAEGGVEAVRVSTDPTFASYQDAASGDGFATWSLPIAALGLAEDVETTVYVRALSGPRQTTDTIGLTLDDAPNPRILVATPLPVATGETIEFQADGTPAASGAAIVAFAWELGDGATSADVAPTHAYARGGTYTVTLTATDDLGRVGTTTRDVLVLNRAPLASLTFAPPMPTTLDTVRFDATATDADGTVASLAITAYAGASRAAGVLATGPSGLDVVFPDDGEFLVVATATDDQGATGETETLVTVYNARPIAELDAPAIVGTGVDFVLDASGSNDPDGSIVEYRFDLGDGSPVVSVATSQLSHSYATSGTYLARVTVVDDDNAAIQSDAVTIVVNAAPVLGAIGNRAVQEGETLAFTLGATDAENDALTFGADALPAGATLDPQTGAFSWTPDFGQDGNYPVTFTVTDGYQQDAEQVILSVGDVDLPPVLAPIGDKTGTENALLAFTVGGSDPDTPVLTYGVFGLPAGATFDGATGAFAWTPTFAQAGAYPVTFTATDGTTTVSEAITIAIANVDRAPTLAPIASATVLQQSPVSIPISATDPDGDIISLTILNPEPGMRIVDDQHGSGTFQWTPGTEFVGPYTVTVVAASGAATATQQTVVTVVFRAGVSLENVAGEILHTAPSRVVEVQTVLRNTGPNTDTFALVATNSAGWASAGLPATVTLAPNEQTTVSVNVTVPPTGVATFLSVKATSLGNGQATKTVFTRIDLPALPEITFEQGAGGIETGRGTVTTRYLDGTIAPNVAVSVSQTWRTIAPSTKTTISGRSDANGVFAFDFGGSPQGLLVGVHDVVAAAKNGVAPEHRTTGTYRILL